MSRKNSTLNRTFNSESGQVTVLCAMAMLPVMMIFGTSLEFSLMSNQKNAIQIAADSGTLTAANLKYDYMTEEFANDIIRELLVTNGIDPEKLSLSTDIELTVNSRSVTTNITYSYTPIFSLLTGNEDVDIGIYSKASQTSRDTEVVFIFDASGSMASYDRMTALKSAAEEALEILLPEDEEVSEEEDLAQTRIGMVTYADMVSAGSYFEEVTGIPASRTYTDSDASPTSYVMTDTCVGDRFGDHAFDDTPPNQSVTRTSEQAKMFNYGSNSDAFVNTSYAQWRQRRRNSRWREYYSYCGHLPDPVALTENKPDLQAHITALTADGGTAGHQGIQWGWYMLSPDWAPILGTDSAPAAYDDPETSKFMVLMTDGSFNSSFYSSYQGSSDSQARTLCDNIKADTNIQIFAIGFQAPDAGLDVLSYCASNTEMYFEADTAEELTEIYVRIASEISAVRLTE